MLTLIQSETRWGPKELAAHFGISDTRIYQDIRELNRAGVPVSFGAGGYQIASSFFLPAVRLTPAEIYRLLVPAELFEKDPESSTVLESARAKLLMELPEGLRQLFNKALRRTSVKVSTRAPHDDVFKKLHRAVAERRRVRIRYYSYSSNRTTTRHVDPYGLAFRKHAWYLVGHCWQRHEVRRFRLSRIRDVAFTRLKFPEPQGFSLDDYLASAWDIFSGKPTEVVIRFSRRTAPLIKDAPNRPGQKITEQPDGSLLYRVVTAGVREIAWWVIQYGSDAVVLQPDELRHTLCQMARSILATYSARVDYLASDERAKPNDRVAEH